MQNFFFVGTAANIESTQWIISSLLKTKIMATTKKTNSNFKTDPSLERVRENAEEFGRAGKTSKFLRSIFRELLVNVLGKETSTRLTQLAYKVIQTDSVNARGERTTNNGDVSLLKGFNFNHKARLSDLCCVRYQTTVDRATGQVKIDIPSFVPRVLIQAPSKATHFRMQAAAAVLNFDSEQYEHVQQSTIDYDWTNIATEPTSLLLQLPANSNGTIAVAMNIQFFERVNAVLYGFKSKAYNAAELIQVVK